MVKDFLKNLLKLNGIKLNWIKVHFSFRHRCCYSWRCCCCHCCDRLNGGKRHQQKQQQHLCLNAKLILIQRKLISMKFVFLGYFWNWFCLELYYFYHHKNERYLSWTCRFWLCSACCLTEWKLNVDWDGSSANWERVRVERVRVKTKPLSSIGVSSER